MAGGRRIGRFLGSSPLFYSRVSEEKKKADTNYCKCSRTPPRLAPPLIVIIILLVCFLTLHDPSAVLLCTRRVFPINDKTTWQSFLFPFIADLSAGNRSVTPWPPAKPLDAGRVGGQWEAGVSYRGVAVGW
jgi:hypothetical protein